MDILSKVQETLLFIIPEKQEEPRWNVILTLGGEVVAESSSGF